MDESGKMEETPDSIRVTMIVAATQENKGIGVDNALPWGRMAADMQHFRHITMDEKVIVMGHSTYKSLGSKPLKRRINIVMTRNKENDDAFHPDVHVAHSVQEVFQIVRSLGRTNVVHGDGPDEVETQTPLTLAVIGGAQIYSLFLPHTSRVFLTSISCRPPRLDVYFPFLQMTLCAKWNVSMVQEIRADEDNAHNAVIYLYERATICCE